eukprot:499877-Pleurochrysis_carterae.AAC.1
MRESALPCRGRHSDCRGRSLPRDFWTNCSIVTRRQKCRSLRLRYSCRGGVGGKRLLLESARQQERGDLNVKRGGLLAAKHNTWKEVGNRDKATATKQEHATGVVQSRGYEAGQSVALAPVSRAETQAELSGMSRRIAHTSSAMQPPSAKGMRHPHDISASLPRQA